MTEFGRVTGTFEGHSGGLVNLCFKDERQIPQLLNKFEG